MVKGLRNENLRGRNFALTIILGVFISVMVIVLFNLIVSYIYEGPQYDDYCRMQMGESYPVKYAISNCQNCTFSRVLQEQADKCLSDGGAPVYEYDSSGCTSSVKECNTCNSDFEDVLENYNRNTFFIFALIGFVLIVTGLFASQMLMQIVLLPAGAVLVIEAAIKNFNDKLLIIIVFALLIAAAIILALKKLK